MAIKVQVRRGTAAQWVATNPVIASGEQGFETDTGLFKIGDGVTAWSGLGYITGQVTTTPGSVPVSSLAVQPTKTYLGRTSTGTGAVETVSVATLRTDLGIVDSTSVAYSSVIPLDSAAGKRMPQTIITSNTTLSLGAAPVTDGFCDLVVVGDGTHTLSFPSGWTRALGSAPNMAANKRSILAFTYLAIGEVLYSVVPLSDVSGGLTFGTPHVENALPTVVVIPMSGTIGAIIPAVGDITLTGVAGVAVTGVAAVGSNLNITVAPGLTWQALASIAVASGKVGDVSSVLSLASGTLAVTNNITIPAPGLPTTLTAGTPGGTTMPLTWIAPAVNSTQGTVDDYVVEYRLASTGSFVVFSDGVSTTPSATVSGLSSGTSYDFRVKATNATGSSAYSSTLTAGTSPGRITFTDDFTGTNGAVPHARWTQVQGGWTIQGNRLSYNGGAFGSLVTDCTAGNNDFSVDCSIANASSYAAVYIRYVDDSNWVCVQKRGDNGEKLRLSASTAGVISGALDESGSASITATSLRITSVGNTITVYINGSTSVLSGTYTNHSGATQLGVAMNTGHPTDVFDNAVLA